MKKAFDFYINSSFHVAFAVYALVQVTYFTVHQKPDFTLSAFAFLGTISSYNFIKYYPFFCSFNQNKSRSLWAIFAISIIVLVPELYFFEKLKIHTQLLACFILIIIIFYALPIFLNRKNVRNWAGIKIYIVGLSWVGVSVGLPLLNCESVILNYFWVYCFQCFILVYVLMLSFEIIDLPYDSPFLKTIPQKIGVEQTKKIGYRLLLLYLILVVCVRMKDEKYNFVPAIIVCCTTAVALYFSNETKSKYYTHFWVESIPILFWLLHLIS